MLNTYVKENKTYAKLSDLRRWEKNPRKIKAKDLDRLKKQIKTLGQYKPVIVNQDGIVIGGNMRTLALKEMGFKEVWVSVIETKDETEFTKYALSDNDRAGYYYKKGLTELFEDIPDFPFEDFTIDLREPTPLSDYFNIDEDVLFEDSVPKLDSKVISQLGEVYNLGRHRLVCGDSADPKVYKTLMGSKKANMVFTDPPYNVNYGSTMKDKLRGTDNRKIKNDNFAKKEDFYNFLDKCIKGFKPYCGGDVYIAMSSSELDTLNKAFKNNGGHWSTFIIWVKNHFSIGRSNYQRQYEPILYGWFKETSHYWSGARNLGDIYKDDELVIDGEEVYVKADALKSDIWEFDKPSVNK